MVEFVAGLILAGIIAIPLGMLRGRTALNSFLWGVFLGPIGWVVVLLFGRKRCPECRGTLAPGARKCMNCGSSVLHGSSSTRAEAEASLQAILSERNRM